MKTDLKDMTYEELESYIISVGEKKFRARQVYEWIHKKLVRSFDEMTNLSKAFREKLENEAYIDCGQIVTCQESKDGTKKFLIKLRDDNYVESVLMKYHHGYSLCISTQVGCRMGCRFCASTVGGLIRSLKASEIGDQVYCISRQENIRVSNIILMGIGEPLDNFNNVIKFIDMISNDKGLNISQRNITLSTCGLVDKIRDLIEKDLNITLALSLHAPNDELRKTMMPIAERYSVREIVEVCREYVEKTGRRVTFEYSMVEGTNDSPLEARKLCDLLRGLNCHVNLIPLNPVEGRLGNRSKQTRIGEFKSILERNHINVTVRREMGSDIDAACGQLRNKQEGGIST